VSYIYNADNKHIKKNNFDVFIRKHHEDWINGPVLISNFELNNSAATASGDQYLFVESGYNSASTIAFCRLGNGNEKPSMKNSAGQSINLNTGDELSISENTEINFEDLNIDSANYIALRALAASGNVDILFVDQSSVPTSAPTYSNAYGAANVRLSVFLDISGNDLSKMVIQAKKESSVWDDVIRPIKVYNA
jgi:hypothetical protein